MLAKVSIRSGDQTTFKNTSGPRLAEEPRHPANGLASSRQYLLHLGRHKPLLALFVLVLLTFAPAQARAETEEKARPTTQIDLSRGAYEARFYPAAAGHVRGCVVFGSGDGGWSYWEERVARHLSGKGFAVAGVDFNAYAASDYDETALRRDYLTLVAELRRRQPEAARAPVFYGGWSMGAEQSLPAAADPALRPAGLGGLILVAPGARGRYGLRLRDRMGVAPTGPGTFDLRETAPRCADLRMAVFHAGLDLLDDLKWSEGQKLDLRLWTVSRAFHDFSGAGDEFLAALDEALDWLLAAPARTDKP